MLEIAKVSQLWQKSHSSHPLDRMGWRSQVCERIILYLKQYQTIRKLNPLCRSPGCDCISCSWCRRLEQSLPLAEWRTEPQCRNRYRSGGESSLLTADSLHMKGSGKSTASVHGCKHKGIVQFWRDPSRHTLVPASLKVRSNASACPSAYSWRLQFYFAQERTDGIISVKPLVFRMKFVYNNETDSSLVPSCR